MSALARTGGGPLFVRDDAEAPASGRGGEMMLWEYVRRLGLEAVVDGCDSGSSLAGGEFCSFTR